MTERESNIFTQDSNGNTFAIPTVRFLNTTSSGTVRISDATTSIGNISGTYSFATGSQIVNFGGGIKFNTGLFVEVGGTADITILYN